MITIRKVEINQRVIREDVEIEATLNTHFELLAHDGKVNIYFYESTEDQHTKWKIRAYLTGDTIHRDKPFFLIGVLHAWNMTLHFYCVDTGHEWEKKPLTDILHFTSPLV